MLTLATGYILLETGNLWHDVTGGYDGLPGLTFKPVLGLFDYDLYGRTAYLYSLAVLAISFFFVRRIVHSPFGLSLRAIKNNPLRAAAIGVPVNRRLIAIYTLSAFYAGIAGARALCGCGGACDEHRQHQHSCPSIPGRAHAVFPVAVERRT